MSPLILTIFTALGVLTGALAWLAWLARLVRADGYGFSRPPRRGDDLMVNGLPSGPYALTPPH